MNHSVTLPLMFATNQPNDLYITFYSFVNTTITYNNSIFSQIVSFSMNCSGKTEMVICQYTHPATGNVVFHVGLPVCPLIVPLNAHVNRARRLLCCTAVKQQGNHCAEISSFVMGQRSWVRRMSGAGVSTLAPCGYIMLSTGMNSEGPAREGPLATERRRMNHLFTQM